MKLMIALLAVALSFSGCGKFFPDDNGGGGNATSCTSCAYVALGDGSRGLAQLAVTAATSTTTASINAMTTNITLTGAANTLAVNPQAAYLYVGSAAGESIVLYSVASTGLLTPANGGSSIVTNLTPARMAFDPSGQYLFVLNAATSCAVGGGTGTCISLSIVPIDPTTGGVVSGGTVETTQIQSTSTSALPNGLYVTTNTVYVSIGQGGLLSFPWSGGQITSTTATQIIPITTGTSVNGVTMDPTSTYLYAGLSGTNGGLFAFNTTTGKEFTGSPFVTGDGSTHSEYAVIANSNYVYVSNSPSGTITGYAATTLQSATNNTPAALNGSPYTSSNASNTTAAANTVALAFDSTGSYVLSINALGSNDVELFTIGSNGSLGTASASVNVGASSASGGPTAIATTGT